MEIINKILENISVDHALIIGLIVGVIGLIIGVITFLVALKSDKSSWDIAKQSGAFKETNLDISISEITIRNDITAKLLIGIPIRNKKKAVDIGVIPIHLKSTGDKTIKNVVLNFAFTKDYRRESLETLPTGVYGPSDKRSIQKSFSKYEQYTNSTYTIKSIDPGVTIAINELIYLKPTLTHAWLYEKCAKSTPISTIFSTRFTSSNFPKFEVSMNAEDHPVQKFTMEIIVAEVKSRNDLFNIALKQLVESTCDRTRKNSSFFRYIKDLIIVRPIDLVHVIFPRDVNQFKGPPFKWTPDKRTKNVYIYPDKPYVCGAKIKLVTWWRLILQ